MRRVVASCIVAFAIAFTPLPAAPLQAQQQRSLWNATSSPFTSPYKAMLIEDGNSYTIAFEQHERIPRGTAMFSGRRSGNVLSGTAYTFTFDCGGPTPSLMLSYPVEGRIENGGTQVVLSGQRPQATWVLGQGCVATGQSRQFTNTFTLLPGSSALRMEPAPYVAPERPLPSPATINIPTSADATAHPLSLPGQVVFVALPFRCSIGPNGVSAPQTLPVYHQVLDYEPPREFSVCADRGDWGTGFGTTCRALQLSSFRVVCRGGAVTPIDLSFHGGNRYASNLRLANDHLEYSSIGYNNQRRVHSLPRGWGLLSAPPDYTAVPRERIFGPNYLASPVREPPYTFFTWLADASPVPQLALASIVLAAAALAAFGFVGQSDAPLSPKRRWYWIALGIALFSILVTPASLDAPRAAYRAAQADIATLKGMFKPVDGGYIQPIGEHDFSRAMQIVNQARPPSETVQVFWSVFALLVPALLFSLLYLPRIFVGWHYLLVRHPAETFATPALRSRALFDNQKLARSLADPSDIERPPPVYKSRNLFRRAHALNEKIVQDGEIADAAMERDRARAQAMQAQARLRELRKQLPWWRRWSV